MGRVAAGSRKAGRPPKVLKAPSGAGRDALAGPASSYWSLVGTLCARAKETWAEVANVLAKAGEPGQHLQLAQGMLESAGACCEDAHL